MNPVDLLISGFNKLIEWILDKVVNVLSGLTVDSMQIALNFLNWSYIENAISTVQIIAGTLLALKIAVESFRAYVMNVEGNPNQDPGGLLLRSGYSVFAIACTPWIVEYVYRFGHEMASALADMGNNIKSEGIFDVISGFMSMGFVIMALGIVFVVIWLLVLFQFVYRGIKLCLLAVTGPVMAVGLTNPNEGLWGRWWQELVSESMAQALQIFLIKALLLKVASIGVEIPLISIFTAIAICWATLKVPSFLSQFIQPTGLSGAMGGAAQTGGQMVMLRRVLTKT